MNQDQYDAKHEEENPPFVAQEAYFESNYGERYKACVMHRVNGQPVHVMQMLSMMGLIPAWFTDKPQEKTMEEWCCENYGHVGGWYPMKGGFVNELGVYSYPEDPDLFPFGRIETENEVMYAYSHAIFAFKAKDSKEQPLVVRMD